MIRSFAITTALLGTMGPAPGQTPERERAGDPVTPVQEVVPGIQYGAGDPEEVLDLYLPDASVRKNVTLVIFDHGSGDKAPMVRWFAQRGYPVLFVTVRGRSVYPLPVRDAFCAVSWAHAHGPEYGIDPELLVAAGHSGGAILAAHLGTVDDRALYLQGCPHPDPGTVWVRGVISIAGIFDYRTEEEFGAPHNAYTPRYFGGSKEEVPAVWLEASPGSWIDGREPPFLLLHGTADVMVRPIQSERSFEVLRGAGVDVRYVTVPGADHDGILDTAAYIAMNEFIERVSRTTAGHRAPGFHGAL